jgi:tetratricopeptide (TPR) repeat protein
MLATVGDVPVQADNQISLTGLPNVASILEALQRRGLVETDHTRYSLVGTLDQILQQEQDLTPWVDRALSEYVPWAEEHRSEPKRLLEEANAILRLSEWANRAGHWRQVLRLVRAVEGALALGGRWNDWTQVLQLGYQAAQMLDDQTEEAWALHQLGVCAHTMGNVTEARAYLSQALRLRETLGDQIGAAVTRTNLNRIQSDDVPRESLEYAMPAAAVEESKGSRPLRVFLCHTSGDKPVVRDLYHRLRADGIDPWLDEENLVAGQEWQLEIPKAVRASDVVIICISRKSITKAGYVQEEIKYALDVADEQPEGAIFLIPLKLEECQVPERLRRWHYVKLFTEKGYSRLMRALRKRAREVGATVERQPAAPAETKVSGEEELEGSNKFELELASLRRQLAEAEENLRLIQERKSQYVLEVDIPLQLVKEEQRLSKHIGELKQRVGELG